MQNGRKLNLCFISRRPVYPFIIGGAEVSFFEMAKALSASGHNVMLIGQLSYNDFFMGDADHIKSSFEIEQIRESKNLIGFDIVQKNKICINYSVNFKSVCTLLADWNDFVECEINSFSPDAILTHLDGALDALLSAEKLLIPVIHFIRDTFNPINLHPYLHIQNFTNRPQHTIANSKYVANWFEKKIKEKTSILYPFIMTKQIDLKVPKEVKKILFVNPSEYKGDSIVFKLAKLFTEHVFVLAPSWGKTFSGKWESVPNKLVLNRYVSQKELYSIADLVIVPTQKPEAFGRVAVEAQSYGIPVIASDHTGLAESVGDSAYLVKDFNSLSSWISALKRIVSDRYLREKLYKKGLKNVERFSPQNNIAKLESLIVNSIEEYRKCL